MFLGFLYVLSSVSALSQNDQDDVVHLQRQLNGHNSALSPISSLWIPL